MTKKLVLYQGNLDKRLIQKKILNGEITKEDLKGYFESLPDVSENSEEIGVTLETRK